MERGTVASVFMVIIRYHKVGSQVANYMPTAKSEIAMEVSKHKTNLFAAGLQGHCGTPSAIASANGLSTIHQSSDFVARASPPLLDTCDHVKRQFDRKDDTNGEGFHQTWRRVSSHGWRKEFSKYQHRRG